MSPVESLSYQDLLYRYELYSELLSRGPRDEVYLDRLIYELDRREGADEQIDYTE